VRRLQKHSGFTAVEVLLVFVMLALLLMLLVPALQTSRQAARQTECLNRLHQIGIALQNYETVMRVLPPGCVNADAPIQNEADGYHMSWIVQLLPMMDQENLFETIDWTYGAYATNNAIAGVSAPYYFQCSSDPNHSASMMSAGSSYAGCIGGTSRAIDVDNTGLLYLNSSIDDIRIPDGRSNTLVVGEVRISSTLTESGLSWSSGTAATLRSSGLPLNSTDDSMYEIITSESGGFGSWHEGTATMLFADGSAKAMSDKTDLELLILLGDRADGQMAELPASATDRRIRNIQHRASVRIPDKLP